MCDRCGLCKVLCPKFVDCKIFRKVGKTSRLFYSYFPGLP